MARSSPSVPDTKMKGMAGHLARAIFNADNPSKAGSVKSERIRSVSPAFERRHKIIAVLHAGDRASDAPGFQG